MTNQQLLQQLQQLLEAAQNLGAPAAQIVQQIRLLINRIQVLNANDPANQNDVNEFNRLQGEFQRLQQPAPQPQQPPPGQQPPQPAQPAQPAQPPTPQPVQARGFLWWAILMFGSILLIGVFSLLVINALKDKSKIVRIETKEDCFYFRVRNFNTDFAEHQAAKGLEIYKNELEHRYTLDLMRIQNQFIIDTMKIRLEQQKAVELQKEIERLHKEVKTAKAAAERAAARAAEARNAVRQVKSAAPAPPPPPKPTPIAAEYTFTWLNSTKDKWEVWIDGVVPRQVLKPGQSIQVKTNRAVTAWMRNMRDGSILKRVVTKEAIEASNAKTLDIIK